MWPPLWSSDGKFIAAKTYGYEKLFLFDLTTKEWKPLGHLTVGYFHWSSSRDYIYFDTWLESDPGLYRVRIRDGHIEKLVGLKNLGARAWGSWGPWTGLAPDDSPLVLRDVSIQGIYSLDWQHP